MESRERGRGDRGDALHVVVREDQRLQVRPVSDRGRELREGVAAKHPEWEEESTVVREKKKRNENRGDEKGNTNRVATEVSAQSAGIVAMRLRVRSSLVRAGSAQTGTGNAEKLFDARASSVRAVRFFRSGSAVRAFLLSVSSLSDFRESRHAGSVASLLSSRRLCA